jgi:hypothetical protein
VRGGVLTDQTGLAPQHGMQFDTVNWYGFTAIFNAVAAVRTNGDIAFFCCAEQQNRYDCFVAFSKEPSVPAHMKRCEPIPVQISTPAAASMHCIDSWLRGGSRVILLGLWTSSSLIVLWASTRDVGLVP